MMCRNCEPSPLDVLVAKLKVDQVRLQNELNLRIEDRVDEDGDPLDCFYQTGLDKEGSPFSYGNFNDCYSDGYGFGEKDGRLDLINTILNDLGVNS